MHITADWHIHSRNSCDEACLVVAELIADAPALGIRAYGLTDHVHTPYNWPDLAASRAEFVASTPPPQFHFGVEVSVVSQWELDEIRKGGHSDPVYGLRAGGPPGAAPALGIDAETLARHKVEYVIGGTHWPLYVPLTRESVIRDYHRQNMFLATHPLITIIAHPWWWMGHWQDAQGHYPAEPWFDDFRRIPQSLHDEFAAAVTGHGKIVEINIGAILLNPLYPPAFADQYLEYLAALKSRQVRFSIGSDCHNARYGADFARVAALLTAAGITERDLWRLPARTGEG